MSDENLSSKLGFDVNDALASFAKLKRSVDDYATSVKGMTDGSKTFNAEGAKVEQVLKGVSTTLTLATAQLRQYATATNAASQASTNFSRQSSQAQAALGRGVVLTQPLASKVQNVVANRPTFDQSVKITPPPQGFNPIAGTEKQLRDLFRTPIQGVVKLNDQQVVAASKRIELSWGSVIKVFGTQFAYRAVGQIVGAYTSAIDAGRKFELQLAEIQTLSAEFATGGLDKVGAAVSKLSAEFGQPIEGVAKGLYETLSNQIGNAAESTRFLSEALTFSRSSLTSTADSVDLLSGVINSYGLTAASTADISDKLFRTIDLGRVRGEELANTIGRVLPLSAALGISFEEVAASLAHLTIQGVKANDAQTQITNVMLKLIRPTEALKQEFLDLGVATPEAAIAAFGFQGALEKITEAGGTSAQEIGKLFNQIRGTRGVIGLVATDAAKYKETLDEIKNGSTGAAEAAANLIQSTSAGKLTKELTAARNFLVNDFGRSAVDVLSKFIAGIGGGEKAMAALGAVATAAAIATLVFFGNAIGALTAYTAGAVAAGGATATLSARLATLAIPAGLLVALPAVILYFGKTSNATEELNTKLDTLKTSYDNLTKAEIKAMQPQVDAQKKALDEQTSSIEQYFFKLEQLYQSDKSAAMKANDETTASLKTQLSERVGDLERFTNALQEFQDKPAKTQKDLASDIVSSENKVNSARFERSLSAQTDPNVQGRLLAQRSQKVLDAATTAIRKGNVDLGKSLIGDAMSLAERSAGITQTRFIGESQVNTVLNTQKSLYRDIVAAQVKQADAAKKVELDQRANIDNVKNLIKEYEDLGATISKEQLGPKGEVDSAKLKELQDRQKAVAGQIDKGLAKVSTTNLPAVLGLSEIQRRIATPIISPVTGKPTTLAVATDQSSNKVIALLTRWEKGIDVDLRLHIQGLTGQTGQEIAFEGTKKLQTQVASTNTELKKLAENQKEGVSAANDFKLANEEIAASFTAIRQQAEDAANQSVKLAGINVNPGGVFTRGPLDVNTGPSPELTQALQTISDLENQVREALATRKPAQVEAVQGQLARGTAQAQVQVANAGVGNGGTAQALLTQLTQLRQSFDAALNASAKMKNVSANLNTLNQGTQQLRGLGAATMGAADQSVIFTENVSRVGETAAAQAAGLDELTRAMIENAGAASSAGAAAPAANRAFGGKVHYFDGGGMVPRGSDRYPAMLGGNEMVMNGSASRQFYSQLVAMNSGLSTAYRSQGGQVSVGDINVNVTNNGSKAVDGRQIAHELRRELRRNTSFVY